MPDFEKPVPSHRLLEDLLASPLDVGDPMDGSDMDCMHEDPLLSLTAGDVPAWEALHDTAANDDDDDDDDDDDRASQSAEAISAPQLSQCAWPQVLLVDDTYSVIDSGIDESVMLPSLALPTVSRVPLPFDSLTKAFEFPWEDISSKEFISGALYTHVCLSQAELETTSFQQTSLPAISAVSGRDDICPRTPNSALDSEPAHCWEDDRQWARPHPPQPAPPPSPLSPIHPSRLQQPPTPQSATLSLPPPSPLAPAYTLSRRTTPAQPLAAVIHVGRYTDKPPNEADEYYGSTTVTNPEYSEIHLRVKGRTLPERVEALAGVAGRQGMSQRRCWDTTSDPATPENSNCDASPVYTGCQPQAGEAPQDATNGMVGRAYECAYGRIPSAPAAISDCASEIDCDRWCCASDAMTTSGGTDDQRQVQRANTWDDGCLEAGLARAAKRQSIHGGMWIAETEDAQTAGGWETPMDTSDESIEYNVVRGEHDLYTPRIIRGIGKSKEGLCPVCQASGETRWFKMKCSSYWYHLNFYHGISSATGRPFQPPLEIRTVPVKSCSDGDMGKAKKKKPSSGSQKRRRRQGQCHKCLKWIYLESARNINPRPADIYWWKHAQQCHGRHQ